MECRIVLSYDDERTAQIVLKAIEQDNAGYAETERKGRDIIVTTRAKSESSMIHTLEDMLSCLSVAEEMVSRSR